MQHSFFEKHNFLVTASPLFYLHNHVPQPSFKNKSANETKMFRSLTEYKQCGADFLKSAPHCLQLFYMKNNRNKLLLFIAKKVS